MKAYKYSTFGTETIFPNADVNNFSMSRQVWTLKLLSGLSKRKVVSRKLTEPLLTYSWGQPVSANHIPA